jgi:hypothetical protein
VTEESEQMLIKYYVSTTYRIEERGIEVTIEE